MAQRVTGELELICLMPYRIVLVLMLEHNWRFRSGGFLSGLSVDQRRDRVRTVLNDGCRMVGERARIFHRPIAGKEPMSMDLVL